MSRFRQGQQNVGVAVVHAVAEHEVVSTLAPGKCEEVRVDAIGYHDAPAAGKIFNLPLRHRIIDEQTLRTPQDSTLAEAHDTSPAESAPAQIDETAAPECRKQ